MKVFLSWSGDRSKEVAETLYTWLPSVIQALKPWKSDEDITSGAAWFNQISTELQDSKIGIVCLTPENVSSPWLLFEAGAIYKGSQGGLPCALLIGLEKADVSGPLAQLQMTSPSKEEIKKLVRDINALQSDDRRLTGPQLDEAFQLRWDYLEDKLHAIANKEFNSQPVATRTDEDKLDEIIQNTRSMDKRLQFIEEDRNRGLSLADLPILADGSRRGRRPAAPNQRTEQSDILKSFFDDIDKIKKS